jgi:hypothetical protein
MHGEMGNTGVVFTLPNGAATNLYAKSDFEIAKQLQGQAFEIEPWDTRTANSKLGFGGFTLYLVEKDAEGILAESFTNIVAHDYTADTGFQHRRMKWRVEVQEDGLVRLHGDSLYWPESRFFRQGILPLPWRLFGRSLVSDPFDPSKPEEITLRVLGSSWTGKARTVSTASFCPVLLMRHAGMPDYKTMERMPRDS